MDELEFIHIAEEKMSNHSILKRTLNNRDSTPELAKKIYDYLKIPYELVSAILLKTPKRTDPLFKTIGMIEKEIGVFLSTAENSVIAPYKAKYLNGSQSGMLEILEKGMDYKVAPEEKNTLANFIKNEVYYKSNIVFKNNKIVIELAAPTFILETKLKQVLKYKATITDTNGYVFSFKKNEFFETRKKAIAEAKKLINEHYKLPIRNSKIEKVVIRTDENNTIIVFWPYRPTDENYILSNDLIGTYDLASEAKTSMQFFESCKPATPAEIKIAKDLLLKYFKIEAYSMKKIY